MADHDTRSLMEDAMHTFEVSYEVVNSGAGQVRETVQAASEYNARRLIEAKFSGQSVRIWYVRKLD